MSAHRAGPGLCVRLAVALAVTVVLSAPAHAQPEAVRITGRVQDTAGHLPIPAAAVAVTGTTIGAEHHGQRHVRLPGAAGRQDADGAPDRLSGADGATHCRQDGLHDRAREGRAAAYRQRSSPASRRRWRRRTRPTPSPSSTRRTVNQVPAPTIENAIQGKIPGAIIERTTVARPAAGCRSRCAASPRSTATPVPLYVIDGVIVDNETVNAGDNAINHSRRRRDVDAGKRPAAAPSGQDNSVNRIADINPDDIESIEVLKGASASAIYGSKASAGVVDHHDEEGDERQGEVDRQQPGRPLRPLEHVSDPDASAPWRARRRGT